MKFIALITLCWTFLALAQETLDVRFLQTQRTIGTPYSLPISVNSKGEISLFGQNDTGSFSFQPTLLTAYSRAIIEYSRPVVLNRFNFYPMEKDLGWIEVKHQRIEIGAGITMLMKSATNLGLVPYKGSMQTIIRHKSSRLDKSLAFKMPKKLSDLEEWNTEDLGTFQTFGGIQAFAAFSAGLFRLATVSFGLQNQFLVEMQKTSEDEVLLTISEEDLVRRQLELGPFAAEGTLAKFNGKRFAISFTLNLSNEEHHELFKEALDGNLKLLQEKLPVKNQKLTWTGRDRHFYIGIPAVVGKVYDSGHYDLNEDGVETKLDIRGSRSRGFFNPLRNHQDFVYQTSEGMVVVWSSEMNKTNMKIFKNRFLDKGRIIGVKGFDRELPADTKFGSVVSQIGIHLSKKEIENLNGINLEVVAYHLKEKCEAEQLACAKEKKLNKIISKIKELLTKPWEEMRGDLGVLLIKEPAVIYAVVKTMSYKKEVYFKFLSEKFQSLEGSSPIEI